MADIVEAIQDGAKNIQKKIKEKPLFFAAVVGVSAFALYKLFTSEEETSSDYYLDYADGYTGYPTASDSMLDYDALVEQMKTELNSSMGNSGGGGGGDTSSSSNTGLSEKDYQDYISSLEKDYANSLNETVNSYQEQLNQYEKEIANLSNRNMQMVTELDNSYSRNEIIQQMQANSTAYKNATTAAEKQALFMANQELGKSLGATYDSASGKWYDTNGTRLFLTVDEINAQNSGAIHSSVVAQMQANSEAYAKATSTAEKNALYQANQTLGKAIGATYDSASGKWYSQNGSELLVYSTSNNNNLKSYGGVSYNPTRDYAAAIAAAKASGASQSEIDTLTAQRNAKIQGENLTQYQTSSNSSKSSSKSNSSTKTSATDSYAQATKELYSKIYKATNKKGVTQSYLKDSSQSATTKPDGTRTITQSLGGKTTTTVLDSKGHTVSKTTKNTSRKSGSTWE